MVSYIHNGDDMKYIKNNYRFILVLIFIITLFSIKFPYYIDAPGGISNMQNKIEIDGYKSKGSFNITYIKEYKATIPTLLISLFNKDWDVIKKEEVQLENESAKDYIKRDKLFMDEAISNAIYVAYTKANKKIEILDSDITILYVDEKANTNLKVGDSILEINGNKINNKEEIPKLIEKYDIGEKINIKVKNNNKEYNRYVKLIEMDDEKKLGILIVSLNQYKTNPKIKINIDKNESGSSGGLITALTIYNNLIKDDITKGLTIVGTGTIDIYGNVGSIGGVNYKLKSAEASGADIFFVPNGENYKDAIKLKKEKKYKIKVIGVDTFEDALNYLNKIGN